MAENTESRPIQPEDPQRDCPFAHLPPELTTAIFCHLPVADRLSSSLVCHAFAGLARHKGVGHVTITVPPTDRAASAEDLMLHVAGLRVWAKQVERVHLDVKRLVVLHSQHCIDHSNLEKFQIACWNELPPAAFENLTISFNLTTDVEAREGVPRTISALDSLSKVGKHTCVRRLAVNSVTERYANYDDYASFALGAVCIILLNLEYLETDNMPYPPLDPDDESTGLRTLKSLVMKNADILRDGFTDTCKALRNLEEISIVNPNASHQNPGTHNMYLDMLGHCTKLREVNIDYSEGDINNFPQLPLLEKLTIMADNIELDGIEASTSLKIFDVDCGGGWMDPPLLRTSQLEEFSVVCGDTWDNYGELDDTGYLRDSRHTLKKLTIEATWTDTEVLPDLHELRELQLGAPDSDDHEGFHLNGHFSLVNHPHLNSLTIEHFFDVSSLGPIPTTPNVLTTIFLSELDMLSDISALSSCVYLVDIMLSYLIRLKDISPLGHCRALETVSLIEMGSLTDITPISLCPLLSDLSLMQLEGVTDVSCLASHPNLHKVRLEDINANVSVLVSCPYLEEVVVSRDVPGGKKLKSAIKERVG